MSDLDDTVVLVDALRSILVARRANSSSDTASFARLCPNKPPGNFHGPFDEGRCEYCGAARSEDGVGDVRSRESGASLASAPSSDAASVDASVDWRLEATHYLKLARKQLSKRGDEAEAQLITDFLGDWSDD